MVIEIFTNHYRPMFSELSLCVHGGCRADDKAAPELAISILRLSWAGWLRGPHEDLPDWAHFIPTALTAMTARLSPFYQFSQS